MRRGYLLQFESRDLTPENHGEQTLGYMALGAPVPAELMLPQTAQRSTQFGEIDGTLTRYRFRIRKLELTSRGVNRTHHATVTRSPDGLTLEPLDARTRIATIEPFLRDGQYAIVTFEVGS